MNEWIVLTYSKDYILTHRPIEISSKQRPSKRDQVPVHLRGRRKIVDPRFNERFGDYDAKEFRQSYHFITDMRRRELNVRYRYIYLSYCI